MALIVPSGGLVSQVNGKVDGKVYYRGRWGNVVRAWVNPTNTITPQRTAVRALFASLMALFNSLTPDMQDDWNKFASYMIKHNRLTQPYIPTGLQVFLERNINLATISQGPLLLPPDDEKIISILGAQCSGITGAVFLVTAINYNGLAFLPPHQYGVIYTTNNAPAARSFQSNRYRVTNISPPATNFGGNILPNWLTTWNPSTPIVGKKLFAKCVIINGNTGQATPPAFCSQIVT